MLSSGSNETWKEPDIRGVQTSAKWWWRMATMLCNYFLLLMKTFVQACRPDKHVMWIQQYCMCFSTCSFYPVLEKKILKWRCLWFHQQWFLQSIALTLHNLPLGYTTHFHLPDQITSSSSNTVIGGRRTWSTENCFFTLQYVASIHALLKHNLFIQ